MDETRESWRNTRVNALSCPPFQPCLSLIPLSLLVVWSSIIRIQPPPPSSPLPQQPSRILPDGLSRAHTLSRVKKNVQGVLSSIQRTASFRVMSRLNKEGRFCPVHGSY